MNWVKEKTLFEEINYFWDQTGKSLLKGKDFSLMWIFCLFELDIHILYI